MINRSITGIAGGCTVYVSKNEKKRLLEEEGRKIKLGDFNWIIDL